MYHLLLVAIGGAVGAISRHLIGMILLRSLGAGFPWGTLAVNIVGSFLMGVIIEMLFLRNGTSNELRLFLVTGLLGGFTTFSAFSFDAVVLWQRSELFLASVYVIGSVATSILALIFGLWLIRSVAG